MEIYICGTIISIIFSCFAMRIRKKESNLSNNSINYCLYLYCAICSFMPLFLIAALRYDVGTDYMARYVPGFQRILMGNNETYEVGFIALNKIIATCTNNYQWLFVITSLIFCFFLYKSIYEQSEEIWYSIALILVTSFYFLSLNIVRQCLSIAIFLYATKYINENKFIKYLIFILIASAIHISALIYIPIYFACKVRLSTKLQLKLLAVLTLSMPIAKIIITKIINATKYAKYFNTIYNADGFSLWAFVMNIGILFLYYYSNKINDYSKEINTYTIIQFIAVVVLLFSSTIPHIDRIMINFTATQIIAIPTFLKNIKNKYIRYSAKSGIIIMYAVLMIQKIVLEGCNEVLPYKTIFAL